MTEWRMANIMLFFKIQRKEEQGICWPCQITFNFSKNTETNDHDCLKAERS